MRTDKEAAVSSLVDIYTKKAQQEEASGNLEGALEFLNKCSQFAEKVCIRMSLLTQKMYSQKMFLSITVDCAVLNLVLAGFDFFLSRCLTQY